jgi:hypothetical protein
VERTFWEKGKFSNGNFNNQVHRVNHFKGTSQHFPWPFLSLPKRLMKKRVHGGMDDYA